MSTPRGSLSSISRNLKRLARHGDVAGIRAYVCGHAFLAAFNGLAPERRHSAMLVYARAVAECEARAKLPLAAPIALNARANWKLANWRDPVMLAKLADAYAQAKDHEGVARTPWSDQRCRSARQVPVLGSLGNGYRLKRSAEAFGRAFCSKAPSLALYLWRPLSRGPGVFSGASTADPCPGATDGHPPYVRSTHGAGPTSNGQRHGLSGGLSEAVERRAPVAAQYTHPY